MYSDNNESSQKIVRERQKATKIGRILWLWILILGIFGWILWKWYSLLIAIALVIIGGSIYSYSVAKKVQKETGLNIYQQESAFENSRIEETMKNNTNEREEDSL